MLTIKVNGWSKDENIEFVGIELPAKRIVCPRCDGDGKHVNPAIDGHGLSQQDFDEDPDFKESYFSGRYDVQCEECRGAKVLTVVDEERCKTRLSWYKGMLRYLSGVEADNAYQAEMESERRFGY